MKAANLNAQKIDGAEVLTVALTGERVIRVYLKNGRQGSDYPCTLCGRDPSTAVYVIESDAPEAMFDAACIDCVVISDLPAVTTQPENKWANAPVALKAYRRLGALRAETLRVLEDLEANGLIIDLDDSSEGVGDAFGTLRAFVFEQAREVESEMYDEIPTADDPAAEGFKAAAADNDS